MGLSRRQFTKDFKLAAVRRLEQGISIAESGPRPGGRTQCFCSGGDGSSARGRGTPSLANGKQRWSEYDFNLTDKYVRVIWKNRSASPAKSARNSYPVCV